VSVAPHLLSLEEELRDHEDTSHVVVTELERFTELGRRFIRLRFEDHSPKPHVPWRSDTVVLDADNDLVAYSELVDIGNGTILRWNNTHEIRDGVPSLRTRHLSVTGVKGVEREGSMTIQDCQFGPIPESEFTPEGLLDGPVIHRLADAGHDIWKDPVTFADWYWVPLIAGAVSLIVGLGTAVLDGLRSRSRAVNPSLARA
jgi:hypothetical protein